MFKMVKSIQISIMDFHPWEWKVSDRSGMASVATDKVWEIKINGSLTLQTRNCAPDEIKTVQLCWGSNIAATVSFTVVCFFFLIQN